MLYDTLRVISHNKSYWFSYIFVGIFLLCSALYFQFVLDELPCVACIQMRLLISLLILFALAGLLFRDNLIVGAIAHVMIIVTEIVMIERSYLLLGTERGFIFTECGFDLGLPSWFAVDEWLPWLFRIETSCGYTPEILFGITIAEALMVISVALLLITSTVFIISITANRNRPDHR